jgi:tetratricopeptide (TPR) repeat protein
MYLTQKDASSAEAALAPALARFPKQRTLLAAAAAVAALKYDQAGTEAALKKFDEVSPGHPLALAMTGKYLSMGRQYEAGEKMLRSAIERQPNWTEPRVELGLMLNQAGKDAAAREVLRGVIDLDPFNKRAVNTLKLHEELAGYKTLETEHFIIRYRDDVDGVLAADMPEELEDIYEDVTAVFGHKPSRKTLIEIMPDKRWFAIRITGMPWIWTIGACTGPVIAITPPREGRHHSGPFDWAAVIRHEFVHTVTLSQTENRIAHWFTEALAVSQEPTPRDFDSAQLLAAAHTKGELFDLEQINWAFVRSRKPTDRQLAYAQAHWMAEYVTHRFGHETILKMLELSRLGVPQSQIVPQATGASADQFLTDFKQWAGEQTKSWGLAPTPPAEQIVSQLQEAGAEKLDAKLDELLTAHPDHPDLLRLACERALTKGGDDEATLALLLRYATARPVDPWADRRIVEVTQKLDRLDTAISHLEELDKFDQRDGAHASRLMDIYRRAGRLDDAQSAGERAPHRQPYDASLREKAAAIALQRDDPKTAEHHLIALPKIEPDRVVHLVRLAAFYHRQGRKADAEAAAFKARQLDPDAPVAPYLPVP